MKERIEVRLMPDYGCSPLWVLEPEPDNWDLDDAPISEKLKNDLKGWVGVMDTWLNWADPNDSPPLSEEEVLAFDRRGVELWGRLKAEIGHQYLVSYYSVRTSRDYFNGRDLPDEVRI